MGKATKQRLQHRVDLRQKYPHVIAPLKNWRPNIIHVCVRTHFSINYVFKMSLSNLTLGHLEILGLCPTPSVACFESPCSSVTDSPFLDLIAPSFFTPVEMGCVMDCQFISSINASDMYTSLFVMKFEKFLLSGKITSLSQANMFPRHNNII